MKKIAHRAMIIQQKLLTLFLLLVMTGKVQAQDGITLHVGDAAPPLKYSKWLQGTPVKSYSNDRLYVVEFWATWCGPCIAAMPHLSELSKKYKDHATFIGANVWEKTGDKPYESSLPKVTKFLKSNKEKMTYNVVADNNAQELSSLWLKPAGILGIPTTFIVSKGKLAWIGHPDKIDSIINIMLAGNYDVAEFKKAYEKKQSSPSNIQNNYRIAAANIKTAVDAKEFDKAFLLIDDAIKQMPALQLPLKHEKFTILLKHFPEGQAFDYARELIKENKSFESVISQTIADKDSLSTAAYLFAAQGFENGLKEQSYSGYFDKLALTYSKAGKMESAIDAQEKAIAAAKQELKDGKFAGYVFDYTVTDYEATLKKYKKTLKK